MSNRREMVILDNIVEISEISLMKSDGSFGFENRFVLVKLLAGRERPEKSRESVYISCLHENITNTGNLILSESKAGNHSWLHIGVAL